MATKNRLTNEEQWFHDNERKLLKKVHKQHEQQLETYRNEHDNAEREKLRLAHWLKCPKCGNDMKVENLEGIEIERCSICSGIYFDHGELETLLMEKTENRFKFYRRIFGLD